VLYTTQPAAPLLTLAASPSSIVYGSTSVLTGAVTQATAGLGGRAVTFWQRPVGAAAFTQLSTATSGGDGSYSTTVKPTKTTTYKATSPGVPEQTVTVGVAHLLRLSVVRRGSKGTLRGRLGPSHPGRLVVIQVSTGSGWRTLAKVKTSKRSTFRIVRKLKPHGKYRFRARTAADKDHLAGLSPIVYLNKMKVSLGVTLAGRKGAFSGRVTPKRPGRYVIIQRLEGTKWVVVGKAKLSSRSTFRLKKTLSPGAYDFRAVTRSDRRYWGGESRTRHVVVT